MKFPSFRLPLLVAVLLLPFTGAAVNENNLEGRSCILNEMLKGCYACPAKYHTKKKCAAMGNGWAPKKGTSGWCGMAGWGCKASCEKTSKDYGCGCGEGRSCLNVDCVMGDWTEWSECKDPRTGQQLAYAPDEPKVFGVMERTRAIVIEPEYEGAECGASGQEKLCNSHNPILSCDEYKWSKWSACSKTCGKGTHTRTRNAEDVPDGCLLTETQSCQDDYCYYFKMMGRTGEEVVDVIDGDGTRRFPNVKVMKVGVNSKTFTLNFVNGPDRYLGKNTEQLRMVFGWYDKGVIDHSPYSDLNKCGQPEEGNYCNMVRIGKFYWGGTYTMTFD